MPDLLLEVRDTSDNAVLSRTNRVVFAEVTDPLDEISRVKLAVPLSDPCAGDLTTVGRYVHLEIDQTEVAVSRIYEPPKQMLIGSQQVLQMDMFGRFADLLLDTAEDSRWTTTALSTILGTAAGTPPGLLYNTGWTLSIEGAAGSITANHEAQGEPLASMVRKVVEDALETSTPIHWRTDSPNKVLYVGAFAADSGIRIAQADAPPPDGTMPTVTVEILEERGTGEIVNSIDPYGGSDGSDRVTIQGASGGAYAVSNRASRMAGTIYYLEDAASVAAYGRFRREFSDNSSNSRNLSSTQARDKLYDASCSDLARSKDVHKAWRIVARGTILRGLMPGQSVNLCHRRRYTTPMLTGDTIENTVSLSETAYVTKVVRRVNAGGGEQFTIELGSSLDHKIGSTEDEQIGKAIAAGIRASGARYTNRAVTEGLAPSAGSAPKDGSYVTIDAESGLSNETLHSAIAAANRHPPTATKATDNVHDPPADAELDTAFGTPATVGDGFVGILDDAGAGVTMWLCIACNSKWWYEELTAAT